MKCMIINKKQKEYIGTAVRSRRHLEGWTIAYLAERADLDTSFVGEVELGYKGITLMSYLYLCAALELKDPTILIKEALGDLYQNLLKEMNEYNL